MFSATFVNIVGADSSTHLIVIGFKSSVPPTIQTDLSGQSANLVRVDDILHLVMAETNSPETLIAWAESRADVDFSHVDQLGSVASRYVESCSLTSFDDVCHAEGGAPSPSNGFPNDKEFWSRCIPDRWCQWSLRSMNMRHAWNISKGSSEILVAIVDTGVDYDHPDLFEKVLRVDGLVVGMDFVNGDPDPYDDVNGHGTMVAGIIGAQQNNLLYITGMSSSKLIPIRACSESGSCGSSAIASGIAWSAVNGAEVIAVPVAFAAESPDIARALEVAKAQNALVVAPTGNHGGSVAFPASSDLTVGVGASAPLETIPDYSGRGPGIDVVAPGGDGEPRDSGDIHSLLPTQIEPSGLGRDYGTSYAAAHVAGLASLVLSVNPALSPAEVRFLLRMTAKDIGSEGFDDAAGYGLIDPKATLEAAAMH